MESVSLLLLIFVVSFLALLFLGWAIAFAIATASILAYIFLAGGSVLGGFATLGYHAMFNYGLLALPIFILMGEILIQGGVAGDLYDAVLPLMERIPGGLIHTNIAANTILGACCGSTVAATSAMSTVAIPELRKRGYAKEICYGSLASAGCLSCLIPPSVGMILFCSITTVSLGKLFIAGIIPGLILAVCFSLVSAIWIKLQPNTVPRIPKKVMPLGRAVLFALKKLWPLFILIIVVLGVIYLGVGTPTESGCYGVVGAIVLSVRNKKLNLKTINAILINTAKVSVSILFIIAMASVYGYALNALGLKQLLLHLLGRLAGGTITKIYIIWLIFLFLGMFLDSAAVIVLTTPILLPFAISLGFEPIWFGIFLMLAVQLGNITPPVGVTLFAVQAITEDRIAIISKGCLPYWVSFFLVSSLITLFPILVTWLPSKF